MNDKELKLALLDAKEYIKQKYPALTDSDVIRYLMKEYNKRKESKPFIHYSEAIHFAPTGERSYNVRCLNGSAHVQRSNDINRVTCENCLDLNTEFHLSDSPETKRMLNELEQKLNKIIYKIF